jgi:PKD repeat protein
VSYQWSFGDGTSGSGSVVNHAYPSGGTRTVTLTVTDTIGQPDSTSRQVSVCADSVLPSVSITEPDDGDYVWGSLVVRANASDASGIDRVEFRVNNTLRCTDTTAPYSCTVNVDGYSSGNKTLRARAFDTCGNSRQDSVVAFFVSNPLAIIDTPAEGATVEGGSVRIAGWASDPDGIASVSFELDGEPLPLTGPATYGLSRPDVCDAVPLDDPNCPNVGYEAFFDSRLFDDGEYELQVVAVDNDGRTTRVPTPARSITIEQPVQTEPCEPDANTLCLMGDRFQVEASFVQNSVSTPARARTGTDLSGYFWFFNSSNLEIGIKVLDGTGVNGHYWVFHGGLTSLEYTLRVTDTQTGDVKTYVKPAGSYCGDPDSQAFPDAAGFAGKSFELADGGAAITSDLAAFPAADPSRGSLLAKGGTTCTPGSNTLCLLNDRFQVRVNRGGNLQPAIDLTPLTGAFWFFNPGNTEVIVKVLDGTGINGHYWVFLGSLTDQAYTATVTDTVTGQVWTHVNPAGTYCGTADTAAF